MKKYLNAILLKIIRLLKNQFLNFETYYRIQSLRTSYDFMLGSFQGPPVASRDDLLALIPEPESGDMILEFGVYKGESINQMARQYPQSEIHGFDSFEGLPMAWGILANKAHFDVQGNMPNVPGNVKLHKGWFKDTLPVFVTNNMNCRVFLIHIDCDIYQSTKDVFDLLGEKLVGAYILFDEYFGYPGWEFHEHRALLELIKERKLSVEYLGCTAKGKVMTKITATNVVSSSR